MGKGHPFTVEVREHSEDELRFGWKIFERGTAFEESICILCDKERSRGRWPKGRASARHARAT